MLPQLISTISEFKRLPEIISSKKSQEKPIHSSIGLCLQRTHASISARSAPSQLMSTGLKIPYISQEKTLNWFSVLPGSQKSLKMFQYDVGEAPKLHCSMAAWQSIPVTVVIP